MTSLLKPNTTLTDVGEILGTGFTSFDPSTIVLDPEASILIGEDVIELWKLTAAEFRKSPWDENYLKELHRSLTLIWLQDAIGAKGLYQNLLIQVIIESILPRVSQLIINSLHSLQEPLKEDIVLYVKIKKILSQYLNSVGHDPKAFFPPEDAIQRRLDSLRPKVTVTWVGVGTAAPKATPVFPEEVLWLEWLVDLTEESLE